MLTYPPTIHPPTYLPTYLARARFGNYEAARRSSEAAALGSYTSFLPTYLVMQFCPDKVLLPTLTRGTPLLLLLFYLNIHFKARLIKSGLLCRKNFKGMFENETATYERTKHHFLLFVQNKDMFTQSILKFEKASKLPSNKVFEIPVFGKYTFS